MACATPKAGNCGQAAASEVGPAASAPVLAEEQQAGQPRDTEQREPGAREQHVQVRPGAAGRGP